MKTKIIAFVLAACFPLLSVAKVYSPGEIVRAEDGLEGFILNWTAEPDRLYHVEAADELEGPWQTITPEAVAADSTTGSLNVEQIGGNHRFFRIVRVDTDPPEIRFISPIQDGVAVQPGATLVMEWIDETGVDPDSIVVQALGDIFTTDSAEIALEGNRMTFQPADGRTWGGEGEAVSISVSGLDLLGNVMEEKALNFQLALPVVTSGEIVAVGGPPASTPLSRMNLPGVGSDLELVSIDGESIVFRFTGGDSGLQVGQILASFNPLNPYYRKITGLASDGPDRVRVGTEILDFADTLEQGSFTGLNLIEYDPETGEVLGVVQPQAEFGTSIEFELGDDFSNTDIYPEKDGLRVWIPEGNWSFIAGLEVSGNVRLGKLEEVDLVFKGEFDNRLVVRADFSGRIDSADFSQLDPPVSTSKALINPIRKLYGVVAGEVPVWIELVLELEASYELEVETETEGYAQSGYDLSYEIGTGVRLRDGEWGRIPLSRNGDFKPIPIAWDLEGGMRLKGWLQPKLTVYVYSVAGANVDLKPYLEFKGRYDFNPLYYEWDLVAGLESRLGLDLRGWDEDWASLPGPWTLLDWDRSLASDYGPKGRLSNEILEAPRILTGPQSIAVRGGETLVLSAEIAGRPKPGLQWYRDGQKLFQRTEPVLTIDSAKTWHGGLYELEAKNSQGEVRAQIADVAVTGGSTPSTGADLTIEALGLELIAIPAGTFTMGSPSGELGRDPDEGPLTQVTISRPFWLGKYEVTQGQWEAVMGNNPSSFTGNDRLPVERVTWHDAVAYCEELNERFGDLLPTGYRFGLPTEAQWEYTCRAGTTTRFSYGDDLNYTELSDYGWFGLRSSGRTHPVGEKLPNPWGLHDMHGNLWEWCSDWWSSSYPGGSVTDPVGPNTGLYRVLRGGGWDDFPWYLRSAYRYGTVPPYWDFSLGFRVALQFSP